MVSNDCIKLQQPCNRFPHCIKVYFKMLYSKIYYFVLVSLFLTLYLVVPRKLHRETIDSIKRQGTNGKFYRETIYSIEQWKKWKTWGINARQIT